MSIMPGDWRTASGRLLDGDPIEYKLVSQVESGEPSCQQSQLATCVACTPRWTPRCTPEIEWIPPQQEEAADEIALRENHRRGKVASKAIAKFLREERAQTGTRNTVVYIQTLPGKRCDLGQISSKVVGDMHEFPGTTKWEVITNLSWEKQLVSFGVSSAYELVDLQSDLTVCVSIFTDAAYSNVPHTYKAVFAVLVAASILLGVGIAVYETMSHQTVDHDEVDSTYVHWCEKFVTKCVLNYLSAPIELMVAPFRMSPFGGHLLGRNVGFNIDERGPIILKGETGIVPWLTSRQFLVKLPKVALQNIIVFGLTLYMKYEFVGHWTGAMAFSVFLSIISLIFACYRAALYLRDVSIAKAYFLKVVKDPDMCIQQRTLHLAELSLKQPPFTCPLL